MNMMTRTTRFVRFLPKFVFLSFIFTITVSSKFGTHSVEASSSSSATSSSSSITPGPKTPLTSLSTTTTTVPKKFGRISDDEFILTPDQVEAFRRDGCITIPDVVKEDEVESLVKVFDRFVSGEIHVPGHDFCDMSKPFGVPYEEWSLVNCMLPTVYHPPLQINVYERLCQSIARQLFKSSDMTKDYDQLLNKRPGKADAVFAFHQDMAYWPSKEVLGVDKTDTCTFSLALDDSLPDNGCLRYVVGSGTKKALRPHRPAAGDSREDGHALVCDLNISCSNNKEEAEDETIEEIRLAPAKKGSITIHDEWVVHGSGGNNSDRQRRTYVVAFRDRSIVDAERRLGFTHSHNDKVNWDTFEEQQQNK
mmetsp:Transcript_13776/g.33214  ORF Transcript_13776/g.33214 Transcript_13776/m.33214 type:complete len:364 (-) Transcript_13776:6-1097(-)